MQKEIDNLKVQLVKETKQIDKQAPQVDLSIAKLEQLLLMYEKHIEIYFDFILSWKEYCDKYEHYDGKDDAE